uniref:Probable membrane transporter protein n=1 Tax=Candidatus Kentrum sp. FM TaxID=2126340 RepID=A0A450TSJ0_9GAMM|nr:MAG: hypothetical protein BECKFM1743C_GA0114222_105611 [Candidatus Kentron sp. FM]VFJ71224.1 MAG: hypothetical protein BECKFM1743A_GA0114220_105801 [Candidatus Kentron sp. FM]VFK18500.1 MAG: hypothetical protein BECKFM1743B_GA0114221_105511 [Candidatus Kentron sp. FM]
MIDLLALPSIWVVVIAAAILRAFTGFGFGLAAVPAFALFLTPTQSVVLSVSLTLAVGIQGWPQYRDKVSITALLPMSVFVVVGTILGTLLLIGLSLETFQLAIGVVTILACLILTLYHPRSRRGQPGLMWGTSLFSGLMNGAFAMPGPPIIVYTMATEPDPDISRAFLIMFLTFSSVVALASYGMYGLINLQSVYLFLFAYPAMYLGNRFGSRLFFRHGRRLYRRVALTTLFFIGLSVIGKALLKL